MRKLTEAEFFDRCVASGSASRFDLSATRFKNVRTPVSAICPNHGLFTTTPLKLMSGFGCKVCDYVSGKQTSTHLNLYEWKQAASEIHKHQFSYEEVTLDNFGNVKVPILCPKHGLFLMRKSAHVSTKQRYGCRKCSKSYSSFERRIEIWLQSHCIDYIHQYSAGLIGKKSQPMLFDFYLPTRNIFIEFDGPHHFMPVKFNKSQTTESQINKFNQVKFNDGVKTKFVSSIPAQLIRICYTRGSEVEDILAKELIGTVNSKTRKDGNGVATINSTILDPPFIQTEVDNPGFTLKVYI